LNGLENKAKYGTGYRIWVLMETVDIMKKRSKSGIKNWRKS
jgi:hypothetical protein